MNKIKKINLRINNIIFYIKNNIKKRSDLCKYCGKPKYMHFYRVIGLKSTFKNYCFPYGSDLSKFEKNN